MKSRVLEFVKYDMHSKALEAFEELGEDEELGPADWTTILKYVSCLKDLPENGRPTHPHGPPSSEAAAEGEHVKQQMQDTRIRFLNGKLDCCKHFIGESFCSVCTWLIECSNSYSHFPRKKIRNIEVKIQEVQVECLNCKVCPR